MSRVKLFTSWKNISSFEKTSDIFLNCIVFKRKNITKICFTYERDLCKTKYLHDCIPLKSSRNFFLNIRHHSILALKKEFDLPEENCIYFKSFKFRNMTILEITQRNHLRQLITLCPTPSTDTKVSYSSTKLSFDLKNLAKKKGQNKISTPIKSFEANSCRAENYFNGKSSIKILNDFSRTLRAPTDPLYWSNFWDVVESGLSYRITTIQLKIIFDTWMSKRPSDYDSFNFFYFIKALEASGYPLSLADYNKILDYLFYRENNFISSIMIPYIWEKIFEHQFVPNQETYSAIISKYLELRYLTDAAKFIHFMLADGFAPTNKVIKSIASIPFFVCEEALSNVPPSHRSHFLILVEWRYKIIKHLI